MMELTDSTILLLSLLLKSFLQVAEWNPLTHFSIQFAMIRGFSFITYNSPFMRTAYTFDQDLSSALIVFTMPSCIWKIACSSFKGQQAIFQIQIGLVVHMFLFQATCCLQKAF